MNACSIVILILQCLYATSSAKFIFRPQFCNMKKEAGLCRASVPMYYYNQRQGKCLQFIYGGCGGNLNRFKTIEGCKNTCKDRVCSMKKKPGPCWGYLLRYYYNNSSGKCETFIYGGCQGNRNRFRTMQECQKKCGQQ
ncbi:tissue factor pathway inhibitor isoform X1 [Paramuricea clavata]|uniref:Tissue factor pathway inhibitor isoform X1 n=3 Tax=Paramuricea clavata TaxID=317549 RepID=A0A6S7G7D9_PARCT|nr:tissue factor pathway inhibitor isoform X1 [Paramuricea clavata]